MIIVSTMNPMSENTVIDDDNKYGVICYRSDDEKPRPLSLESPESPSYDIIMSCIHSTNIVIGTVEYGMMKHELETGLILEWGRLRQ